MTDLRELRAEKMKLEIAKLRHETSIEEARAAVTVFELAKAEDQEADRLAKVGSRRFRQLDLDEPIFGGYVRGWIAQLEHWERRDPGEPILIRINSPGGSVIESFALLDTILRLRRKGHYVETHGMGMIASMASILMQAGDERVLDANSWFMIHEVANGVSGKTSEIEEGLKFQKRLEDRLLDILAERSVLTKTQIRRRWKKTDDWMSAEEAVKLRFADRVE